MTDTNHDNETPPILREFLNPLDHQTATPTPGQTLQSLGQPWTLAHLGLARSVTQQRDSLYDDSLLREEVDMPDIYQTAWVMLSVNYHLDPLPAIQILQGFDRDELIAAVLKSILAHNHPFESRTYTNWARSALLANNLDPQKIPVLDLPHVLRQLTTTGRAIPLQDFTAAAEHHKLKAEFLTET